MSLDKIVKILLVFIPITVILELTQSNPVLIFAAASLPVIPLADLIGEATAELAMFTVPNLGGMRNAP